MQGRILKGCWSEGKKTTLQLAIIILRHSAAFYLERNSTSGDYKIIENRISLAIYTVNKLRENRAREGHFSSDILCKGSNYDAT
jgi:hypothetical protein